MAPREGRYRPGPRNRRALPRRTDRVLPLRQTLIAIIAEGVGHRGRARIAMINRAVNLAITPMSDQARWGVPDRWSAPLETLQSSRGDCEDYAMSNMLPCWEQASPKPK